MDVNIPPLHSLLEEGAWRYRGAPKSVIIRSLSTPEARLLTSLPARLPWRWAAKVETHVCERGGGGAPLF